MKTHSNLITRYSSNIALVIAVAISIGLPGLFFSFLYNSEISGLNAELDVAASQISRVIHLNPLLWQYEEEKLKGLLRQREYLKVDDNAYILRPDGKTLLSLPQDIPGPFVRREANLTDAGKVVARLVLERSLYDPLQYTVFAFILSTGLSFGLFFVLRGLARNIGSRAEQEILQLAFYDPQTSLPNRRLLNDRIEQNLQYAERESCQAAVLLICLDRFKSINDSYGFNIGDHILKTSASRLESCLRGTDTVARYGVDEFAVIMSRIPPDHETYISGLVNKITQALQQPVVVNEQKFFTTCCIGIAVYPFDGNNHLDLLRHADLAMTQARKKGAGTYQFFSMGLNRRAQEQLQLETDLRQALELNQHFLVYQPKLDLQTGKLSGIEALLRWRHPQLGLIPPQKFITLAEETGQIQQLGNWVLVNACRQHVRWQQKGLQPPPLAVNLSILQLRQKDFIEQLQRCLRETGMPPAMLELELTESCLMENHGNIHYKLMQINQLGSKIAIDDFGTGYSSLSYLKHFPVDRLKIDRSFVVDIATSDSDRDISKAIIAIADSLNLQVTAEGVETAAQQDILQELGCHELQGFFYRPPLSDTDLEAFLSRELTLPATIRQAQRSA